MAPLLSWRNPVSLSCLAVLAVFVPLMFVMLDLRMYVDVNSGRLMSRWQTGFLVVPLTTEVTDTDFSRLAAELHGADAAAAPVWKPVASRMPFLPIHVCYRRGATPYSLRLLVDLIAHLDLSQEERAALIARALDLLREDQPRELDKLVHELDEIVGRALPAGEY